MPVKYYLHPNALVQVPESYRAIVEPHQVYGISDIIAQMLQRGTTLSEADILASLHLFFEVVAQQVQEGNHVNLPIVNIKPSILGRFTEATDSFDATRHALKAATSAGILIKKNIKKAAVVKFSKPLTVPILSAFTDVLTQTDNDLLSPGGIGTIVGNHLKFDKNNPSEGLFFVSAAQEQYAVTVFATLHPRKLLFSIPNHLPQGQYSLVVKKAFGKNNTSLREGKLATVLRVL
ncbi:DNA-binding domain-containing protein [Flavobacterium sp. XGLA_31]|uniref:DNA-binding domain-containing protein n=1 Tax=Flavobacterium sp. XGLA_31 TaxID=3447666 RepID=UPI003F31B660